MTKMDGYKHWRLEGDVDGLLWLYFDKAESRVNTLDREVMEELSHIMDSLKSTTEYKGMIIASGKDTGFIAGADITVFNQFKDISDATQLLREGQIILDKIEQCTFPVVAMIKGFCLGGGLELALACHYRVAENSAKTKLGLPEVKLGIHPGWGGTIRLARLIGGPQALKLILTGSMIAAKAAEKQGIVDVSVPERHLVKAARYYALNKPPKRKPSWIQNLSNQKIFRMLIAYFVRKEVRAKADPSYYPSPFKVISNWEEYGVQGTTPFEKEAQSAGRLFFSETAINLVRVFFLQDRLKGLGKESSFSPEHIHVVGAGTMGGDIAAWCALQGLRVTIQDRDAKSIAPAIKRAYQLFKEKLKEAYLIQRAMDRLIPDTEGQGVWDADIVIEAIFEDLAAKQALFKTLEQNAKPNAILATNTSSIPLDEINRVLREPERLVGIHFFNPVSKMLLVEVVKGEQTQDKIVSQATAFVRKIDRLPLPVKSSPGFLVNRILMPYLLEAVNMVDDGIPPQAVDKAMVDFGMPMGPVALGDAVGLDVCLSVANHLSKYFPVKIPKRLEQLVNEKKLGRKTGEGFYKYTKEGKQIKPKRLDYNQALEPIADRLVLRMLDEAFACLREAVVHDADLLDAGMIFGTGFAPFRGGPIHYAEQKGIAELYEKYLKQLSDRGELTEHQHAWETQDA